MIQTLIKPYRNIIKNMSIVMFANVLKLCLGILLIPIYVSYVSPEELGKFDLVLSFLPIINQLISMGLTNSLPKFYLKSNDSAYLIYIRNKLFQNSLVAIGFLCFIYFLFYSYLADLIGLYAFFLFLILLFIENITFVQFRIYNLNENFKKHSIVALITDLIRYLFIIIFVIIMDDKLLALLFGTIISCLFLYLQTYKDNNSYFNEIVTLTESQILELKYYSTPLIFLGLSGFFYLSLDMIIVSVFASSMNEAGYLGMAQRLTIIVSLVITSVATVLGITIFKTKNMNNLLKIQNKYLYFLLFFVFLISSLFIITEKQILQYLLSDNYKESYSIGILLIMSLFWNKCRENIEFYFLIKNQTKLITKIFAFFTIFNLLLSVFFVNIYDALGVVFATNLSFFFHSIILFYLAQKKGHLINMLPFMLGFIYNILIFIYLFYKV